MVHFDIPEGTITITGADESGEGIDSWKAWDVDKSRVTSVAIPSSVTSIGTAAFRGCSLLASLAIPASVIRIGDGAFSGCTSLASLAIPSSVTSVGAGAFSGCPRTAMPPRLCTPRVVLEAVRVTSGGDSGGGCGGGGGGGYAGGGSSSSRSTNGGGSHQTSTAYWDFFYDLIANPTVACGWGHACVFDAAGRAAKTAELTEHWGSHGVGMYSLHTHDGTTLGYCRLRVVEEGVELLYVTNSPHPLRILLT